MKKLDRRKELAAKVLGAGKNKIKFDSSKLASIKEAITKQDIKDLYKEGIIAIKEKKGKKTKKKRKTKRGPGKIKKKVKKDKQRHVKLVRKLRGYIKELKKQSVLDSKECIELRKKVKAREFRDKAHLKEYIGGSKK